jgi:hypothetical protein
MVGVSAYHRVAGTCTADSCESGERCIALKPCLKPAPQHTGRSACSQRHTPTRGQRWDGAIAGAGAGRRTGGGPTEGRQGRVRRALAASHGRHCATARRQVSRYSFARADATAALGRRTSGGGGHVAYQSFAMSFAPRGMCAAVRRTCHGLVTRKPEPSSCTGPLEAAASHVRPITAGCRPMTDAMMVARLTLCMVHCLIVCMTCNGGCRRLPLQPPAQGRVHPLGVRVFGTLGAAGFHLCHQRRTRARVSDCGPPCFWCSARSHG